MIPSGRSSPVTPARHEVGLPEAGFVFCCFNDNWKISAPAVRYLDAAARLGAGQRAVAAGGQSETKAQPARRGAGPRRRSRSALSSRRVPHWRIIWPAIGWPICSWTRCPTMPIPRPATPCGQGCRWSPAKAACPCQRVAASLLHAQSLPYW